MPAPERERHLAVIRAGIEAMITYARRRRLTGAGPTLPQ
jgi:hypothetical protein